MAYAKLIKIMMLTAACYIIWIYSHSYFNSYILCLALILGLHEDKTTHNVNDIKWSKDANLVKEKYVSLFFFSMHHYYKTEYCMNILLLDIMHHFHVLAKCARFWLSKKEISKCRVKFITIIICQIRFDDENQYFHERWVRGVLKLFITKPRS